MTTDGTGTEVHVPVDAQRPPGAEPRSPTSPPWRAPVITGAVVACGCAAVALWDPGDGGTPLCWSQSVLGIDCPLCGGLRCTNALLRGDWSAAADHNVLLAVLLPVAAVVWAVWLVRSLQGHRWRAPRVPAAVWVAVIVVLVGFTVVRNVGGNELFDYLAATAGPPSG